MFCVLIVVCCIQHLFLQVVIFIAILLCDTEFVVTPGRSWMLQTDYIYYIHVEIFDKESRKIYPSEVCCDLIPSAPFVHKAFLTLYHFVYL